MSGWIRIISFPNYHLWLCVPTGEESGDLWRDFDADMVHPLIILSVASWFFFVAPILALVPYLVLPTSSKWRRPVFLLYGYFIWLVVLWCLFIFWIRLNTNFAVSHLLMNGVQPSRDLTWQSKGPVEFLVSNPLLLTLYLSCLMSMALWCWRRGRLSSEIEVNRTSKKTERFSISSDWSWLDPYR